MECKDFTSKNTENQTERKSCCTSSLLQGDEVFFNRILSRDTSKGFSSRNYFRSANGIPFKWETQPGMPKNLWLNETIPPLSPPPMVHSLGLALPCADRAKCSTRSRVWFWMKNKKSQPRKKKQSESGDGFFSVTSSNRIKNLEFQSSDGASSRNSSSSSLSLSSLSSTSSYGSSSSSKHPVPRRHNKMVDIDRKGVIEGLDSPLSCIPWNFTGVLFV